MAKNATRFEYEGFAELSDKLDAMKISTPEFQEKVRKAVWEVLADVRKAAAQNAHFEHSTHNSIMAIRRSVYRKVMGGAVGILSKRKGKSNAGSFKATGQSSRTQQINDYRGDDRAFVLRFVNSGTEDRYAGEGRNKYLSRSHIQEMRGKPGFRGKIAPKNFFAPAAKTAMQKAADRLATIIESEMNRVFYDKA